MQSAVQEKHWSSLKDSHLYFSYPPYVAFLLKPLSYFNPVFSKFVFCSLMFIVFVYSLFILSSFHSNISNYEENFYKLLILSFLYFPNLSAVFSGQNLALSLFLFMLLTNFTRKNDKSSNIKAGVVTGLWFFKPHFALIAVLGLVAMRKWLAVLYALVVASIFFLISFLDWKKNWILTWLKSTKEFYHLDSIYNGHKQISFIGFFENLSITSTSLSVLGYFLSFLFLVFFIYKCLKNNHIAFNKYLPFAIVFCSPHTMFYESGIVLIPFLSFLVSKYDFKHLLYLTILISAVVSLKINLILLVLICIFLSLSYLNFCHCSVNTE